MVGMRGRDAVAIGEPYFKNRRVVAQSGTFACPSDITRPVDEILWTLGPRAAATIVSECGTAASVPSAAFPDGGAFVMRNDRDHVYIDCGPVGQGGRGGHGHNDCLSFEALIDGCHLIADCGAYLYTASVEERNNFRSTAYHNTPQIDRAELNRIAYVHRVDADHVSLRPLLRPLVGAGEEAHHGLEPEHSDRRI